MIAQAFEITLIGMGGVFFFLMILICALHILEIVSTEDKQSLNKIAVAIAWIKRNG
ncbi:MAG: OadG family transporter subunit [Alphaproteobacteria bacterium]